MFDDMEDLFNQEIQGGKDDGTFSLRCRRESVLHSSWGSVPPCTFPRAVRLKVLGIIIRDGCFGAHLVQLET